MPVYRLNEYNGTDLRNRLIVQISRSHCLIFQFTQSLKVTPVPPKISSALPIVRSTFPALRSLTLSKSSSVLPPPAYVTGIVHHLPSFLTNSSSMPFCSPSLSAAWIKNSEQYGSNFLMLSARISSEFSLPCPPYLIR